MAKMHVNRAVWIATAQLRTASTEDLRTAFHVLDRAADRALAKGSKALGRTRREQARRVWDEVGGRDLVEGT